MLLQRANTWEKLDLSFSPAKSEWHAMACQLLVVPHNGNGAERLVFDDQAVITRIDGLLSTPDAQRRVARSRWSG